MSKHESNKQNIWQPHKSKADSAKSVQKTNKAKNKQSYPVAYHLLVFSFRVLIGLFALWIFSSLFLRSVIISYSAKTQRLQWETERIQREIQGAQTNISGMTSHSYLKEIARELGLEYRHHQVHVIATNSAPKEGE